jgi:L-threonylcarbamoyladenylate synthase
VATMNTQVISAHEDGAIAQAVEHLISGQLVAVPTETVYGLAANAADDIAVQQIYTVKGRPSHNPLICHVSDAAMTERYVDVNETALKIMAAFWPGPLTLVLPKLQNANIPTTVTANLKTLAVRCPQTDFTRQMIETLGHPIAAPSANPSGKLSPTRATDVVEGLGGKIPLVIDGGATDVGIESTIIGVQGNKLTLLRPGTITADDITEHTGFPVFDRADETITAPGQLLSHYAPDAAVRLNASKANDSETLIGFGNVAAAINLSSSGDLNEAAKNLFACLRAADAKNTGRIAVAPIPMHGVGIAINDRLKRAAAPRDNG